MKGSPNKIEEIDDILESIKRPVPVDVPIDLKKKIEQRIEHSSTDKRSGQGFLQWAAVWTIILCNFVAYYTYIQNPGNSQEQFDEETSIELLVEEYYQEENLYEQSVN